MATWGRIGFGSVLAVTTTTAETNVGAVRNIDGPNVVFNDADTTTLDSSSNYRTFIQGLGDPGELTFDLIASTTHLSHKRIAFYMNNRTAAKTWSVYHGSSAGDVDTFSAYVKGMTRAIPLDDVITYSVTLKVTGKPGYTS